MHVIDHRITGLSRSSKIRLYLLGDAHIGHPGVDLNRLKRMVEKISKDPDAYWIGMGDQVDAINVRDPRFSVDSLPDWFFEKRTPYEIRRVLSDVISAQRDKWLEIYGPIANKCLGLLMGNHEEKAGKYTERNIHSELVDGIRQLGDWPIDKDLNLGYSGWVVIRFNRGKLGSITGTQTIRIAIHHGASIAESRLRKYTYETNADIVAWGHAHKLKVEPIRIRELDGSLNPVETYRWMAWTGTAQDDEVQGQTTWGETRGHLAPLGYVVFDIEPYADPMYKVSGYSQIY